MRSCLILSGVVGGCWLAGCASWRQPVDSERPIRASAVTPSPSEVATLSPPPAQLAPESQYSPSLIEVQKTSAVGRIEDPIEDPTDDSLTRFSKALRSGDNLAAAKHLDRYVREHPDQVMFRLQLAELLIQLKKDARAKTNFEQFVACAQNGPEAVRKYLVHAHTRLMEIAQRSDDSYSELFHRGVGLLILVQQEDNKPDRDDGFCEEMLCKSLRALNEAREQKPGDPRVRVYLADVYERMGNRRASTNERSAVRNRIMAGELTTAEQSLVLIRGL
jgi:predicted Zn-dependent protease